MKISFTLRRSNLLKRDLYEHCINYLLLCELLFFAISEVCKIRGVYISFSIWVDRNLFSPHIILMVRDILFEIFWICEVQLRCPSIVRPWKLHSVNLLIGSESIASFRVKEFTLCWWWWKSMNFVSFALMDSMFISSHSKMLLGSLLIFSDISYIFMFLTLYLLFAIVRIAFFFAISQVCRIRGRHELQYMRRQKPFQSTCNSDGGVHRL